MSYLSELLGDAYKDGMSEDEISKALKSAVAKQNTAFESTELTKLKAAMDKANSQAAELKKQLRAKQSEEEAHAQEQQEMLEKLSKENAELQRNIQLTSHTSKFVGLGYDAKLAAETAQALVDGDMEKVFANQSAFQKQYGETLIAQKMKDTPRPAAGSGTGHLDFDKLKAEAQANGAVSQVAYYTRLQAQEAASAQT